MRVLSACLLLLLVASPFASAASTSGQDAYIAGMKPAWPELVGKTYADAEAVIKQENPSVTVRKVRSGSIVTMDYREDRVRVWVSNDDIVEKTPTIG